MSRGRSPRRWDEHGGFRSSRRFKVGPLRIDPLVERTVIVELKSIEATLPIHEAQLLTYLRMMRCDVGLIINFNVPV